MFKESEFFCTISVGKNCRDGSNTLLLTDQQEYQILGLVVMIEFVYLRFAKNRKTVLLKNGYQRMEVILTEKLLEHISEKYKQHRFSQFRQQCT